MRVDQGHSRFYRNCNGCCLENAGLLQSKSCGWIHLFQVTGSAVSSFLEPLRAMVPHARHLERETRVIAIKSHDFQKDLLFEAPSGSFFAFVQG